MNKGVIENATTDNQISLQMSIPENFVKQVCDESEQIAKREIARLIQDHMLREKWYYHSSDKDRVLQDWVKDIVKEELLVNREEIISLAAHELAVSMARSKTVRDRFGDVLEGLFLEEDSHK